MTVIYVSDTIHSDVLTEVQASATVHLGYGPTKVNYLDVSDTVDGVILRAETFSRELIEASPRLRIIARHGVGTDNVDLQAASDQGVWVTTTPGANGNAVAEHVFALLLTTARKLLLAHDNIRHGKWSEGKADLIGFELSGKTLGLVGFGAIGRRVATIARGFGMDVLVSDPYAAEHDVLDAGATPVDLEELLEASDIVSIHAPLLPSTRHMIGAQELASMKSSAVIINTSRGGLIDESALRVALTSGALAGAALDVLEGESTDMKDPLSHSTMTTEPVPGLIITPHIAGQSTEAFLEAGRSAWTAVQKVLAGGEPLHPVNAEQIRRVPA
ncbi:hydroxyacid dehydrogenase [Arthrobacter sp. B0490]|uniref:hydroxyacid dehydrogenase n=1 Tax=Arthrobacter sp. B0490 TaxID=2058891 RepID=UPI000CE4AF7F|nr:hydroxyacid dehydrogenase [Arthrobacter sp. B0490]